MSIIEKYWEFAALLGDPRAEFDVLWGSKQSFLAGAAAMAELFAQGDLAKGLQELAANGGNRAQTSCWIDGSPPKVDGFYVVELRDARALGVIEFRQGTWRGSADVYLRRENHLRFFGFKLP